MTKEGTLSECRVSEESPAGQGFGDAALGLATLFKMRPMTRDGAPVDGGKISIPIRFRLPQSRMPSLAQATRCYGLAAAAAERDPASADNQVMVVAWRTVLNTQTLREHQRPSEFEQMLAELRKSGAARLDDPTSKADRDECEKAVAGPMIEQLKAIARQ